MAIKDRLQEIYVGWKNYTFPNGKVEIEAKRRIEICIKCINLRKTNTCKLCGCYMPAKVRSPKSRCRINKW